MTPSQFKTRFIELIPPVPPDLDLELDRFVTYPADRAALLRISESDRAFLIESGLPADAAPFLNFDLASKISLTPIDGFPDSAIIGHNNYGDAICLDQNDAGAVVYYNHDRNMERVMMNSSLSAFAQSLCAFAALLRSKDADLFRDELIAIDRIAIEPGSFWAIEMAGALDH
jgi:hypothetical protein